MRGTKFANGSEMYIFYRLCGAAGDLSPLDLVRISKHNKKELVEWEGQGEGSVPQFRHDAVCQEIAERIAMRAISARATKWNRPPRLGTRCWAQAPLRLVTREEYEIAAREVGRFKSTFSSEHRMTEEDVVMRLNRRAMRSATAAAQSLTAPATCLRIETRVLRPTRSSCLRSTRCA